MAITPLHQRGDGLSQICDSGRSEAIKDAIFLHAANVFPFLADGEAIRWQCGNIGSKQLGAELQGGQILGEHGGLAKGNAGLKKLFGQ